MSFTAPGISGPASGTVVKAPVRGGDARKTWLVAAQLAGRMGALQGMSQQALDRLALLWGAQQPSLFHPFKIYPYPSILIAEGSQDPSTDWLKFMVRAGNVLGVDATGTDGANSDPDTEAYPSASYISVPANTAKFWFWLEIAADSSSAVVRYGDVPSASRYPAAGAALWTSNSPWSGAPVPDAQHVPIGWVDTNTHAAQRVAVVRQLLRADIVQVWGGGSPCALYG